VKPLQSKPAGSLPPLLYGTPRSDNAVPTRAFKSVALDTRLVLGPFVPSGAEAPPREPGTGNGFGTAPVEAQADVAVASAMMAILIPLPYRRER